MSPDSGTSSPGIGTPCSAADAIVLELKWPAAARMKIAAKSCLEANHR
jgi:hypothetical protein